MIKLKQFRRGFRHGRLGIYNPGLMLYGKALKLYRQGYLKGTKLKHFQGYI